MRALRPELPQFPYAIAPVDEAVSAHERVLKEHVENYSPVVLRGYARDWALARKFAGADGVTTTDGITNIDGATTVEAIRPLLGDATIPFTLLPAEQRGDIGIGENLRANFRVDDRVVPAQEFLKTVSDLAGQQTDECAYAASMPVKNFPYIDELLPVTPSVVGRELWNRLLWVGSGRHVVDLHHDQMLNLITLFAGVKRITLLPPSALPFIYPAPLNKTVGGVPRSLVKLLSVDLNRYPRFETALPMARQVVLNPGDTLHIPPLWWHYVESYGVNVMVNTWFQDVVEPAKLTAANSLLNNAIADHHSTPVSDHELPRYRASLETTRKTAVDVFGGLPTYWQDWMRLQFEYYVLRAHGDPYPTLPGALADLAAHFRAQANPTALTRGRAKLRAAARRAYRYGRNLLQRGRMPSPRRPSQRRPSQRRPKN